MSQNQSSLIYIVKMLGTNYYKIGRSKDFKSRFEALQTSTPHTLEVVGVFDVGNAFTVEAYLHYKLRNYKIRGEWFELIEQDILRLMVTLRKKGAVQTQHNLPVWEEIESFLT